MNDTKAVNKPKAISRESESDSDNLNTNPNTNIEQLDEDENSQASYQIRPELTQKFKPQIVRELIHTILNDQLESEKYNAKEAYMWCKQISDMVKTKLKDLNFRGYKYVVNVILGEQKGAGLKIGTRCIWDVEADDAAYEHFTNETLFCVVCVYALFRYI